MLKLHQDKMAMIEIILLAIGFASIMATSYILKPSKQDPQIISYTDEWCLYSLDGGSTVKAMKITEYDIKISGSVMGALKKKI